MQSTSTAPSETESSTRRRVIGFFMFPIALFPLLALCSYDWRAISDLCIPAQNPTSNNLIGMAGDWFAYTGYQLIGLGVWSVPVLCVYVGLRLVLGKTFNPGRRTLGVTLLVFSVTCLLQVADSSPIVPPALRDLILRLQRDLNIEPGQTSEDGLFSVELVNCLGSCALAPVMVVDGNYHNKLRVEQIPGIIDSYAAQGAKEVAANA